MRYWSTQGVQPRERGFYRFDVRERIAEEVPVRFNDFPQLAEVCVVKEVIGAERDAALYFLGPVPARIIAHELRHQLTPPVTRVLLGESCPQEIANRDLKTVEELIVLRHGRGVMADAFGYLRVIRITRTFRTQGPKLYLFFTGDAPEVVLQRNVVQPEMACSIRYALSRFSLRLRKIALKTSTSDVSGKLRLIVYERLKRPSTAGGWPWGGISAGASIFEASFPEAT